MSLIYRFGEFELDTLKFEMRRSGSTAHTQPKVLRVLIHLAANHERSVSAHELLETLWPREAVTAASVKRAVAGARRALGEDGGSQQTIRTVRGHGYRFVREVHVDRRTVPRPAPDDLSGVAGQQPPPAAAPDLSDLPRESVIAPLLRVLAESNARCCQALLIHGGPGAGKTSTLRELIRRARQAGAIVLWARCTDHAAVPPLWPVLQLLQQGDADVDASLRRSVLDRLAARMEPGADADQRRELVHGSRARAEPKLSVLLCDFAALLQHSAERRPVLLALDDIHLADTATLQLMAALIAHVDRSRVTIAATMRPLLAREPAARPHLRALESRLSEHRIELDALSVPELERLAGQRLSRSVSDIELAALQDWTGGNPRLCSHVLSSAEAALGDLERYARRPEVGALIERQLSSLPPLARDLLGTAAVIGRDFSSTTLARVAEIPAEHVLGAMQDAVTLGLVVAADAKPAAFRFRQGLVRAGLYARIPHAERVRAHARVATALDEHRGAEDAAQLACVADHWLRAYPSVDWGRGCEAVVRAARAALKHDACEDAVAYLERALGVAALAGLGARERLELTLELATALVRLGDVPRANDSARQAARLALDLNDTNAIVLAAQLLGRSPVPSSADTSQRTLLEASLAAIPPNEGRRAGIEALVARAQVWSRDPQGRATRARSALAGAREMRDPAERAEALRACLPALADPEFLPERLAIAEELESIGHGREDRALLVAAACARVWTYCEVGDMLGIDASIRTLELLALPSALPFAAWNAKVFHAMRAIIGGRLDQAARYSREAYALGEKLCRTNAHHVHCSQMAGILRLEGQLEQSAERVREISLRHPAIAGWQAALASMEAELGRVHHGREVLKRLLARGLAPLLGDPFGLGALAPAADLCALVGDAGQARLLYDQLLPYSERHGVISMGINTHGPLARHLGRLAMRMNDAARAESHLKRAIEEAERCESPTFVSLGCLSYAQMLVAADWHGARSHAAALTRRAFEIGTRHRLQIIVERALALATRANFLLRTAGVTR